MLVLDARRLRARLALRGWTQGDLSEKTGVAAWALSRMVQGHEVLHPDVAAAFARALGCEVEDFADRYEKARG